jgi:hypothetical protein
MTLVIGREDRLRLELRLSPPGASNGADSLASRGHQGQVGGVRRIADRAMRGRQAASATPRHHEKTAKAPCRVAASTNVNVAQAAQNKVNQTEKYRRRSPFATDRIVSALPVAV